MVNLCAAFGCSNRSNRERDKGYFRIPAIVTRSNAEKQALSFERRATWLSRIRREDLGEDSSVNFTEFAETTLYQVCINTVYHSSKGIIIAFGDSEPSSHWVRHYIHIRRFYA